MLRFSTEIVILNFFFFFLQWYTDDKEKRSYIIYWLCWIHLLLFKEQEAREPPETGNPLWSLFYKAAYSAAAAAASQPPVQDWFCVKRLRTGCGEMSTQQYENKVRQSKTSIARIPFFQMKSHSQNTPGSPRQEIAWKGKGTTLKAFICNCAFKLMDFFFSKATNLYMDISVMKWSCMRAWWTWQEH